MRAALICWASDVLLRAISLVAVRVVEVTRPSFRRTAGCQEGRIRGAVADVADVVNNEGGRQRITVDTALLTTSTAIVFGIIELSTAPIVDLSMLAPAVPLVACAGPTLTRAILRA